MECNSLTYFDYIFKALWYGKANINDFKCFPSITIKANNPLPWIHHPNYNKSNLSDELLYKIIKYKPVSFIIVKDNYLLFEKYFNNFSEKSLCNNFSVTKSIVSIITGMAMKDCSELSLDTKISNYLEWLNSENSQKLTIEHLLTMSAGLDFEEKYPSLFSSITKAYYCKDLIKFCKTLEVITEPGLINQYQSVATQLLSLVIEKATKKNISYYAQILWNEIGAEYDALWSTDKKGMIKAFCCFCTTAKDLAKIGKVILNKGRINNKEIVTEEYLVKSLTPASYLKNNKDNPVDYYGFHWWISKYQNNTIIQAKGINGQYLLIIPEKNAIIVRQGYKKSNIKKDGLTLDLCDILDVSFYILEKS